VRLTLETENNLGQPEQPRRFELEQTVDYSQYLLHSKPEILAVLRSLIQKRSLITVYFNHGQSFFLTSLIEISNGKELIFDIGNDEEMNRKALQADRFIFTTLVDKVKVQFSLNSLSLTQSGGRPAFQASLPESLLRLQRREFFRLSTPVANPLKLSATAYRHDGSALKLELPLLDISGGGIGLMMSPDEAVLLERGTTLTDCRISLPQEGLLTTSLCVRNLFDVTTRNGSQYVRVGCEYVGLSPAKLTMVQRYITRTERERKARLSGMA